MKLRACLMTTCRNEVSAAPAIAPEWAERIHTVERSPTVRSPDTPGRRPPDARIPARYPGRIAPAHRTGSRVRPTRPVPIRARSRHAGESGPGDGTRGYEDGAPHCCGAPSAQADQLPSFTTTRRDGLLRLSWVTLTTYLPRLIAVSGYRGLRGELRPGVGGVSLPLRPWPGGGP